MLDKSKKIAKVEQGRVVKVLRKTVLPLILGFILALQPVAYAAAAEGDTESGFGATTTIGEGGEVDIAVLIPTVIGNNAVAVNTQGVAVVINPGPLRLNISNTIKSLVLPMTLPDEQDLESFSDPDTGISISGNQIVIPIRNQAGKDILYIKATKGAKTSGGTESTFALQNVVLVSKELAANFSGADEDVGIVGASFKVGLKALPEGVTVKKTITKTATTDCHNSFVQAIRGETQDSIKDTAYILEVTKTNLENNIHLGGATITMKVGKVWADAYGYDNIAIIRCGEDGSQRLKAEHIGFDGDNAIFEAESPVGLSFFGLVALGAQPIINFWYIGGGIGGAVLVFGLTIFLILRRRRIRDAMLTSSWPTGLRPEDWKDPDSK